MTLVIIAVLIFSIVCHEVAHGWTAYKFGDPTAKYAGRITLNPIPHIDLFGSIIVPGLLLMTGAPVLAWAKPVPVDFGQLRPRRLGMFCVSIAGVAVNLAIALVASLLIRWGYNFLGPVLLNVLLMLVMINVLLAIFNLVPIPPLDGSRLLTLWLPEHISMRIESMSLFFFIALIMLISYLPIWPLVQWIVCLLTGMVIR